VLYLIVQGQAGFTGTGGFATNGYAELSPGKYSLIPALMIEIVLTAMFLIVIMGAQINVRLLVSHRLRLV
jgi:aquaporin Z